jgi:uncharacterized OB-fold protein
MAIDTREAAMAMNEMKVSPAAQYIEYCRKGQLAYQVCLDDNKPVFYPRVAAPGTGSRNLEWRVSKGLGTVYATTTTTDVKKGMPDYNVCMVEVDEGFRMMSRIEDIPSSEVKIGMRVKMRMHPGDEKNPPYPVFVPAAAK